MVFFSSMYAYMELTKDHIDKMLITIDLIYMELTKDQIDKMLINIDLI